MAREIVVWCDVHLDGDERVDADEFTVTINGAKPRTIALCVDCQEAVLNTLAAVLDDHGVADGAKPKRAKPVSRPVETSPDACLVCGDPQKAMGAHLRRQHDQSILDTYGTVCPLCGEEFTSLGTHVSRGHAERGGVAGAFAAAAQAGDPHGVVAERRNHAGS